MLMALMVLIDSVDDCGVASSNLVSLDICQGNALILEKSGWMILLRLMFELTSLFRSLA